MVKKLFFCFAVFHIQTAFSSSSARSFVLILCHRRDACNLGQSFSRDRKIVSRDRDRDFAKLEVIETETETLPFLARETETETITETIFG